MVTDIDIVTIEPRAPFRELHLEDRRVNIDAPAPPLEWIVPNIAARGLLTILSGEGGIGKTSLMLQSAAIAGNHGERTAFISAENVGALHMLAAMRIDAGAVAVFDGGGISLGDEADRNGLEAALRSEDIALVVLDSLRTFAPGKTENSSDDMAPYIGGLSKVADNTRCAIVTLHHFNRAQSPRGSFAIRDQADFTLTLEKTRTPDVLRLAPDKWRVGRKPDPWHVRREYEPLRFLTMEAPASGILAGLQADLLAFAPGTYTTEDLRVRLGLDSCDRDRKRLSDAVSPLIDRQKFERLAKGVYRRL
jgi:AAA domain